MKITIKLLVACLVLTLVNCQQEDDTKLEQPTTSNKQEIQTTKIVSGKDIPEVMSFLEYKVGSRLQFTIDESNSPEGQNRSHEDNLILTNAITEQIKQVTNNYGKSNYTFNLIEEQTREGTYFLNLVVKEYKDTFYMYIVKYVPSTDWLG